MSAGNACLKGFCSFETASYPRSNFQNRDLSCLQVPDNVNARQLADTCSDTLEWLMKSGDQVHENELTSRLSMLMREAEPDKYGRL